MEAKVPRRQAAGRRTASLARADSIQVHSEAAPTCYSTNPIRKRSNVGSTLLPRTSTNALSFRVALVTRGSFGRFSVGREFETLDDTGIWSPASMPKASHECHIQSALMRGVMNHVSRVKVSV